MRLPIIMIIISYLLLILTDWYIITDLKIFSLYDRYRPEDKRGGVWWKVYLGFAIAVLIVLTVGICLPRRNEFTGLSGPLWLLFIVTSVLFSQIVYVLCSFIGCLPLLFKRRRWNTGLWVGLPMSVLIFSMMWWGSLYGRDRIKVNEIEIDSPKIASSFNGFRIAQISDLHLGTWGNDTTFVSNLVDSVNNLNPDLILFTGDIVNRTSDEILPFLNTLSRLKSKYGVFSVMGNHDYGDYVSWDSHKRKIENKDSLYSYQHKMGWIMLNNAHTKIKNKEGDAIVLIGVENWGEPPFSQYGSLTEAYPKDKLKDENFKILMTHNPEHWNREVSEISNIDLTLSGHTHAMQILLGIGNWKWSPAKYKYEQWAGLYERENEDHYPTKVYVNIGAGEVGLPMRIGATPEITLFTLHNSNK